MGSAVKDIFKSIRIYGGASKRFRSFQRAVCKGKYYPLLVLFQLRRPRGCLCQAGLWGAVAGRAQRTPRDLPRAQGGTMASTGEEGASSGASPPPRAGSERSGWCLLSHGMQIFLGAHPAASKSHSFVGTKGRFWVGLQDMGPEGKGGTPSLRPAEPGPAHPTAPDPAPQQQRSPLQPGGQRGAAPS